MKAIKYVCDECGSEDILFDAYAEWDIENQSMILHSNYDHTTCNSCGAEDSESAITIKNPTP